MDDSRCAAPGGNGPARTEQLANTEELYGVSQELLMTRLAGILALLLAIVVLLVPSARAEDSIPEKDIDAIFRKLDTNKDGRLSKDEFLKIADRFRDRDR